MMSSLSKVANFPTPLVFGAAVEGDHIGISKRFLL